MAHILSLHTEKQEQLKHYISSTLMNVGNKHVPKTGTLEKNRVYELSFYSTCALLFWELQTQGLNSHS